MLRRLTRSLRTPKLFRAEIRFPRGFCSRVGRTPQLPLVFGPPRHSCTGIPILCFGRPAYRGYGWSRVLRRPRITPSVPRLAAYPRELSRYGILRKPRCTLRIPSLSPGETQSPTGLFGKAAAARSVQAAFDVQRRSCSGIGVSSSVPPPDFSADEPAMRGPCKFYEQ
jgi:hypothetical protein